MEQLSSYIQQCRSQGLTDVQIYQALLNSGWSAELINQALGRGADLAQAPIQSAINAQQEPNTIQTSSQALHKLSIKNHKPLIIILAVVVLLTVGGGVFALRIGHKTNYQTVIQQFITAMQNKDRKQADSLESSAAKIYFQKNANTSSFYQACEHSGQYCTGSFNASFLSKATKVYKAYKANNGTQGKEVVYTIKQTSSGGQGCTSNSTSTLTIAVVPTSNSWLIDLVDFNSNVDGNLCSGLNAGSAQGPTTTPTSAAPPQLTTTTAKTAPSTVHAASPAAAVRATSSIAFAATANAPVFSDQGSYSATSGNNLGQCKFNIQQSYSVNGPGSVSLNDFETTSDPNNGPNYSTGYGNQNFTQAGSDSVSNPQSFATSYQSHVVVSDYFQVVNSANGQVIATSPTSHFTCP